MLFFLRILHFDRQSVMLISMFYLKFLLVILPFLFQPALQAHLEKAETFFSATLFAEAIPLYEDFLKTAGQKSLPKPLTGSFSVIFLKVIMIKRCSWLCTTHPIRTPLIF